MNSVFYHSKKKISLVFTFFPFLFRFRSTKDDCKRMSIDFDGNNSYGNNSRFAPICRCVWIFCKILTSIERRRSLHKNAVRGTSRVSIGYYTSFNYTDKLATPWLTLISQVSKRIRDIFRFTLVRATFAQRQTVERYFASISISFKYLLSRPL